jgi:hypothetical protein
VRTAVKVNVCARTGTAETINMRRQISGASRALFAELLLAIPRVDWKNVRIGVLLS